MVQSQVSKPMIVLTIFATHFSRPPCQALNLDSLKPACNDGVRERSCRYTRRLYDRCCQTRALPYPTTGEDTVPEHLSVHDTRLAHRAQMSSVCDGLWFLLLAFPVVAVENPVLRTLITVMVGSEKSLSRVMFDSLPLRVLQGRCLGPGEAF